MGWKRPLGFWHLPCEEILQVYCMMAEGAAFELQLVVAHALGTSGSVSDASSVYCCLISLLMTQKSEKTDLSCKARSSRGLQGGEFQKVAEWLFHPPWRIKFGIGLLVQQDCVLVTQSVLLSLSLSCVCARVLTCMYMEVRRQPWCLFLGLSMAWNSPSGLCWLATKPQNLYLSGPGL